MQLDFNKLSIEDKLKLMELIWSDLLKTEEEIPSPEWHKEEFLVREKRVKDYKEKMLD